MAAWLWGVGPAPKGGSLRLTYRVFCSCAMAAYSVPVGASSGLRPNQVSGLKGSRVCVSSKRNTSLLFKSSPRSGGLLAPLYSQRSQQHGVPFGGVAVGNNKPTINTVIRRRCRKQFHTEVRRGPTVSDKSTSRLHAASTTLATSKTDSHDDGDDGDSNSNSENDHDDAKSESESSEQDDSAASGSNENSAPPSRAMPSLFGADRSILHNASRFPRLPRLDELDRVIFSLWVPALANFFIIPLVGAVDVFWVGRAGDPASLAAMGAANQTFSSAFWIISFLPSLVTPLVAQAAAKGDKVELQRQVGEAVFVASLAGLAGTLLLALNPMPLLSLAGVQANTVMGDLARDYVTTRAITFIPATVSTVALAAFRGTLDVVTPLKVTFFTQMMNVMLDPVFIFGLPAVGLPALGVKGAAIATCVAEVAAYSAYMVLLLRRKLILPRVSLPSWTSLKPLLEGGLAVQIRSVALNWAFLNVTRATLLMDASGTSAAAHTLGMQIWNVGGTVLLALMSTATALIPQALKGAADKYTEQERLQSAKAVSDRIVWWGILGGAALGSLQLLMLPLLPIFTPVKSVSDAAFLPSVIGAFTQIINGCTFALEGIMTAQQAFMRAAIHNVIGAIALVWCLETYGSTLVGVWSSFIVFNGIRSYLAAWWHFRTSPLADRGSKKRVNSSAW